MKFFIDCDAHDGCSVRKFRHRFHKAEDYVIHCFEPNPKFFPIFNDLDVLFHPVAVWSRDESRSLYIGQINNGWGSTLFPHKTTGNIDRNRPLNIWCINFSRWLAEHSTRFDDIILKLDIEGAEYELLTKMFEN